jgi:hypothetical protein
MIAYRTLPRTYIWYDKINKIINIKIDVNINEREERNRTGETPRRQPGRPSRGDGLLADEPRQNTIVGGIVEWV